MYVIITRDGEVYHTHDQRQALDIWDRYAGDTMLLIYGERVFKAVTVASELEWIWEKSYCIERIGFRDD